MIFHLYKQMKKKHYSNSIEKFKIKYLNSVSFGTEAGVFNKLNIETIVCGPGNIQQAHKPNEFIEQSQVEKCRGIFVKSYFNISINLMNKKICF